MSLVPAQNVALVAIGRNEGERLEACLRSIAGVFQTAVYVDSGSTDGSPERAAAAGCAVVRLDPSRPFSAARGRNEGFERLRQMGAPVEYVQFLDGDCELAAGWVDAGRAFLEAQPDVGIVCGRLCEIEPERSLYKQLCDLEWRQSTGEINSTGGNFMVRAELFHSVGGFRAEVIAAEDDEFCVRVRQAGWKIFALRDAMARHDAAIYRFSQWWQRARRTGHAYAQVHALHGQGDERYFAGDLRKIWTWGLLLPAAALLLAPFTYGISLLAALLAYGFQFVRIYGHGRERGWTRREAALNSLFVVLSRAPGLAGALGYYWRNWRGHGAKIIEYKRSA